jgi:hypothetical protein
MKKRKLNPIAKFLGLLTILFVTLKVTKIISWSWWWIFSPLWTPIALIIIAAIVILIIFKVTHKNITLYKNQ